MRKGIIIGIGILIILLALAGTASAKVGYTAGVVSCTYCHNPCCSSNAQGDQYKLIHKFDGSAFPTTSTSCGSCHTNMLSTFFPLTSAGQNYSVKHNGGNISGYANRSVNCTYCHTAPYSGDFSFLGAGTSFGQAHKFNGVVIPKNATGCTACHPNVLSFLPLNETGQNYTVLHNGVNASGYIMSGVNCTYCHTDPIETGDFSFLTAGTKFEQIHKFNGVDIPNNATSCVACHPNVLSFMPLGSKGPYYNATHRYNGTILGPEMLSSPGCYNCHVDNGSSFTPLISGTATYLTSSTCQSCHKKKYDDWYGTMHRVMLTKNTSGAAMNLTVPDGLNWSTTNVTYMIVGKPEFRYLNETGWFFSKYYTENQTFKPYGPSQYSCGRCHTTGYNASGGNQSDLPGIIGTWTEEGIGCENCHGAGGNGHNVTVDPTGQDCLKCHDGDTRQGPAVRSKHKTAPAGKSTSSSCTYCHSPYDNYKRGVAPSIPEAVNVTCMVCHNPHGITDDQYGPLLSSGGFNATNYSNVKDPKLSFFNATASNISKNAGLNSSLTEGNDKYDTLTTPASLYPGSISSRKDSSYGNASINVTGPVSEVLCSMCHYRHGLAHIVSVNLTHGRNNPDSAEWGTCIDCHMGNAGGKLDHSFDAKNKTNYPEKTCSKGTNCHITSNQNQSASNLSLVSLEREWNASAHNATKWYKNTRNQTSCRKCHEPMGWDGSTVNTMKNASSMPDITPKGIACAVCHNLHDMGDWINKTGVSYAWYNRSYSSTKAKYEVMSDTIGLCGNCHSNDNPRIFRAGPGWNKTTDTTPISPHGWPAKDIFVGSWKQSGPMNFECIDCHMYRKKTNDTGFMLNDADKITGHSFKVNETGLQNTSACSNCHVSGTSIDTIENVVAKIQADTKDKWNFTNITVLGALANYNAYTAGPKNLSAAKIAQAYWNLRMVYSDDSWGVHDPVGTKKLLDDAMALANASNASLGMGLVSTVNLTAGWNLVALNGTPSDTSPLSVMSSVSSNITVVWGYNTSSATKWELYDPLMPSGLNSLKKIVPGQGYWIYAKVNTVWTV